MSTSYDLPDVEVAIKALKRLGIEVSNEFPAVKMNPFILEIRVLRPKVDEVREKLRKWVGREPKWGGQSLHFRQTTWAIPSHGTLSVIHRNPPHSREEVLVRWQR